MIPDPITDSVGKIDSLTVEKALFVKKLLKWEESERLFEARYSWDAAGNIVSIEKNDAVYLYAYDKNRNKTAGYCVDKNSNIVYRETWKYNSRNQKIKYTRIYADKITENTYEYENDGKIQAEKNDSGVKITKYSENNLIIQEYYYLPENQDYFIDYKYGKNSSLIKIIYRTPAGEIQRITEYEWDASGRLTMEKTTDSSGTVIKNEKYVYGTAEHDGRWLERVTWVPGGGKNGKHRPKEVIYRSFTIGERGNREKTAYANGLYNGKTVNGKPEGPGKFFFNDGSTYEGFFHKGKIEGHGKLTKPDGSVLEGIFYDNMLEGEGICRWQDGSSYRGEFRNGRMHGKGTLKRPDGSIFTGLFENGQRTDQGVWEEGSLL